MFITVNFWIYKDMCHAVKDLIYAVRYNMQTGIIRHREIAFTFSNGISNLTMKISILTKVKFQITLNDYLYKGWYISCS